MARDIRNIFVSFSRHNVLIRQQCRAGAGAGAERGVVGKHVALHARYNFRCRCPLPSPPRPLSLVIHFCIHFAHLMPCLLSLPPLYPTLSHLLLFLCPSSSPSPSPTLSLTNCAACVSLLAKKLKALRPVYVCLCPSAPLFHSRCLLAPFGHT